MKRQWEQFWGRSWKVKGPVLGVAAFLLLAAIGAATSSDEEPIEASPDSTLTDSVTQAVAEVTATSTPKPTETLAPTNTPSATPTPLSFEDQLLKSYRDNMGFMPISTDKGLKLSFVPEEGIVNIDLYPEIGGGVGTWITTASHSSLVASRAFWTTYSEVQIIRVNLHGTATTSTGQSVEYIFLGTTVNRESASRFNYDGLKRNIQADNKSFICLADKYQFYVPLYNEIGDKGCLAQWGPRKN